MVKNKNRYNHCNLRAHFFNLLQNTQSLKILFLPKYPRLGASSRLRTYQYIPLWENQKHLVKVAPFFNEKYLNRFYSGQKHSFLNVLGSYFKRIYFYFLAFHYDQVVIEKELFPFFPAWAEFLLSKVGKGYTVDYDDAVFHNYDQHPKIWIRNTMGDKIDRVMKYASVVFVGNQYLQKRAEAAGAKRIVILPTVIDPSRYQQVSHPLDYILPSIGWIGSPTTLRYLLGILPVLEQLNDAYPFRLIVVNGAQTQIQYRGKIQIISWSEETEIESIQKMDIGIMPLEDSPWERGKCAYKLIQYMACGLPVVASPVGMNKEVVIHGENGFLATTDQEWIESLTKLLSNPHLRQSLGKAGHKLVQQKYTLEKNFEILKGILVS